MIDHLISVIIPVYNTAEYLPRCLDSILNNTYRNLEVICVNDGSKDNSLEVLNAYAQKDPRIRVIDQENSGVSAARNRGLDEANGKYITFVDSDDWIHSSFFEILLTSSVSNNTHITVAQMPYVKSKSDVPPLSCDTKTCRSLSEVEARQHNLSAAGRLYLSEAIGHIRFTPGVRLAEDTIFNLNILDTLDFPRVFLCEQPIYYYYMRSDSAIHSLNPRELEPLIHWYVSHLDKLPDGCIRNYYLIEALKNLFSWRYSVMFLAEPGEQKQIRALLSHCRSYLTQSRSIGMKMQLIYQTMMRFPITYRVFRILNDPTMLGWEKLQREKARAEKNKK